MARLIRSGLWLALFFSVVLPLVSNLFTQFDMDSVFYQFQSQTIQLINTISGSIQSVRGVINACLVESLGVVGVGVFNVLLHLAFLLPVFGIVTRFFIGLYRVLV